MASSSFPSSFATAGLTAAILLTALPALAWNGAGVAGVIVPEESVVLGGALAPYAPWTAPRVVVLDGGSRVHTFVDVDVHVHMPPVAAAGPPPAPPPPSSPEPATETAEPLPPPDGDAGAQHWIVH